MSTVLFIKEFIRLLFWLYFLFEYKHIGKLWICSGSLCSDLLTIWTHIIFCLSINEKSFSRTKQLEAIWVSGCIQRSRTTCRQKWQVWWKILQMCNLLAITEWLQRYSNGYNYFFTTSVWEKRIVKQKKTLKMSSKSCDEFSKWRKNFWRSIYKEKN